MSRTLGFCLLIMCDGTRQHFGQPAWYGIDGRNRTRYYETHDELKSAHNSGTLEWVN